MVQEMQYSQEVSVERELGVAAYPYIQAQLPVKFGRYQLMRVLGVGGMGSVYLAEDTVLERQVALKIPSGRLHRETVQRFLAEARAAAKISHPNVCSVYDVGCEAGYPYLTMEYIDGKPLDQLIAPGKPLPGLLAAKIVLKIAAGLHAAHRKGVIHRDLKPANVLMRNATDPVITDFGLALQYHQNQQSCSGKLLGSPSYMSPEQIRCEVSLISPATDVYGLGTILYELLTGRRAFDGCVPELYSQVLTKSPPLPSAIIQGIDSRFEKICMRALAKSPSDRFDDVLGFGRSLARCVRSPAPVRPSNDEPLVLANSHGRTPAQSMYLLESRTLHQAMKPYSPSWIRSRVERSRRFRWNFARQRSGFVSGLVLSSFVFLLGVGAWMSLTATP